METDEEPDWHETVQRARRADFARRKRANRPFWWIIFEQIIVTSWQLAVGILVVVSAIYLLVRAFTQHLAASVTPI